MIYLAIYLLSIYKCKQPPKGQQTSLLPQIFCCPYVFARISNATSQTHESACYTIFLFFNLGMTWQDPSALNFYTGNLLTRKVAKKESSNTADSVGSACLGLVHICRRDDLKRASSGKDGLLSRGIHLTGEGFVCLASLTVIPGCLARCFASRTRCQTRRLLPSLIRFLTRRDTAFFTRKKDGTVYAKVQKRVSWIKKLDLVEQEEVNLTWQAKLSQL